MNRARILFLTVAIACASACGSRPAYWDQPSPVPVSTYGLDQGVAVVDASNNRLTFLSALADQRLSAQQLALAHNLVTTTVSPDGKSLLMLAAGDWPRHTAADQLPSLTWVAQSSTSTAMPAPITSTQFWMSEPLQNLAIDPGEHWAVAYAGAQTNFVQNPNEIVLFDLTQPPNPSTPAGAVDTARSPNPVSRTLQSFGGIPTQLTFTGALNLGGTLPRHLLVVETNIDVTLIDLDQTFSYPQTAPPSETTVRLTNGTDVNTVTPAGIAVYAGDASSNSPARIAIRASNDTNLFTLVLGGSTPTINLTDVGGIPSDIAFVKTDASTNGGLRVAALVPTRSNAVLVDPDTSLTTTVALSAGYSRLSLVTQAVPAAAGNVDVALLWGTSQSGTSQQVALWTLVNTVGTPYRSVAGIDVAQQIQAVDDVPGNGQLKVLEVAGRSEFVVLDLVKQTAAPLDTTQSASLVIAPDGGRMWVFAKGSTNLAAIDFKDLNPVRLATDLPIDSVYDVVRSDSSAPGRSLIAIHQQGTLGATVFDALNPDPTTSQRVTALLFEGP